MICDLRSDTVTRPTPAMRRAMSRAEVGDDVFGEDPTVRRLEELAAEAMGKAAALLVPSGTMGNLLAVTVHAAGGEVLLGDLSHTRLSECGGHARVASSPAWPLSTDRLGRLDPREIAGAIHGANIHHAATKLLCLENTHNFCGGVCLSVEQTKAIVAPARRRGLRLHLDGARIFNAATALGVPARSLAAPFDSVMFCLSKGLCSPVGSMLCGSRDFVAEARGVRKMLGGGMRQAGVLAACGLYALDHHLERLSEDHAMAAELAQELRRALDGRHRVQEPETNILLLHTDGPSTTRETLRRLERAGILSLSLSDTTIRLVTHLDLPRDAALKAGRRLGSTAEC